MKAPEQRRKQGVSEQLPGESREAYLKREPRAFSEGFYWSWRTVEHGCKGEVMPETITTQGQAEVWAMKEVEAIRLVAEAQRLAVRSDLRGQVNRVKTGQWCTVGEFIEAVTIVLQQRNRQQAGRAISNLRLVIAIGQGWVKPFSGEYLTRNGGELSRRVDGLSMAVVCAATSEAYMLACQVAAGVALKGADGQWIINWTDRNPPVVNRTINSNLGNACVPFSKGRKGVSGQRVGPVLQLAVPWSEVDRFGARRLPVPVKDVGEEVPDDGAFTKMMEGFQRLREGDERERELALINEMLRKHGLRSGELTMARESWLLQVNSKWYLDVRDRPLEGFACKGASPGLLPLNEDLAGRLRVRCEQARAAGLENPFLILPMLPGGRWLEHKQRYEEEVARRRCVRNGHNTWLKTFIGEARSGQGNHRLRKLCATRLYWAVRRKLEQGGTSDEMAHDAAATEVKHFIRHESEATTLLHYIAPDMMRVSKHVTAGMIDEVLG